MKELVLKVKDVSGLRVLDVGCGEGKNASYLAQRGAIVTAIDISARALEHAKRDWKELQAIRWICADVRSIDLGNDEYDLVLAYGVYHCLGSSGEIELLQSRLDRVTSADGFHIVCSFNSRRQELVDAHPGFYPSLIDHAAYLRLYAGWQILLQSDTDLTESHPHNNIQHTHARTRIIARKGGLGGFCR